MLLVGQYVPLSVQNVGVVLFGGVLPQLQISLEKAPRRRPLIPILELCLQLTEQSVSFLWAAKAAWAKRRLPLLWPSDLPDLVGRLLSSRQIQHIPSVMPWRYP